MQYCEREQVHHLDGTKPYELLYSNQSPQT